MQGYYAPFYCPTGLVSHVSEEKSPLNSELVLCSLMPPFCCGFVIVADPAHTPSSSSTRVFLVEGAS